MTRSIFSERSRLSRYAMLATASLIALTVALTLATTASADTVVWGMIKSADPVQGTWGVLNAAGCGNPANVIEWSASPNTCSGGGSNERWDVDVTAGEGPNGTAMWAYYDGNYMCLNATGTSSGAQITAKNCDNSAGGVTSTEKFYFYSCVLLGSCGTSYGLIEPKANNTVCLNIAGGFGFGHNIILYHCDPSYQNELFSFPGWPYKLRDAAPPPGPSPGP